MPSPPKVKLQFVSGSDFALGPGKADLLAAIAATGSISAAGRQLRLSYRRSWLMVDTMNRCWRLPVVATSHGGSRGGGAVLTPFGEGLLDRYRTLQAVVERAATAADTLSCDLVLGPTLRSAK